MIHKFIALIVASSLAACSTTPLNSAHAERVLPETITRYAQQKPGTLPLNVTRDAGLLGSACSTEITLDGEVVAYLRQGQTVTLFVPAGEYVLGAKPGMICFGNLVETDAVVKPGRQANFRVSLNINGTMMLSRTASR